MILKGFRIKSVDGGWLHLEETEDLQSIRVCVDYGDAQSALWLDKDAFNELMDLHYKLDVHYPVKEVDEEVQDATPKGGI